MQFCSLELQYTVLRGEVERILNTATNEQIIQLFLISIILINKKVLMYWFRLISERDFAYYGQLKIAKIEFLGVSEGKGAMY